MNAYIPELAPRITPDGRSGYALTPYSPEPQAALLALFCVSIATFEGWYIVDPPSISRRNNNPGNLRPIGGSGFRTFENELQGWQALKDQVVRNIKRRLTLREFFLGKPGVYPGYAPLADNDPQVMENYIDYVSSTMQISKNVDLGVYFPKIAQMSISDVGGGWLFWVYQ